MKNPFKNLFAAGPSPKERAAAKTKAKRENDELLRAVEARKMREMMLKHNKRAKTTSGVIPFDIDKIPGETTLTIDQITGDIRVGDNIISGNISAQVTKVDAHSSEITLHKDRELPEASDFVIEEGEPRYFLIKGLHCFKDPNLTPLDILLFDPEGLIIADEPVIEENTILSFSLKEIPKEGLDLDLTVRLSFEDHQTLTHNYDQTRGYDREYRRTGKFPNNPETKRIVLDLSTDPAYQKWVEQIKRFEKILENHYKTLSDQDMVSISGMSTSSAISASAGGVASAINTSGPQPLSKRQRNRAGLGTGG